MATYQTLTVSNIEKNTPDSVLISFTLTPEQQQDFSFKAGQYITLKKNINNQEVRRAYSICSIATDTSSFTIGVKKVENGVFSTYANTALAIGDTLEVHPPEGRFILDANATKTLVGIAAGSGITPIMSILKTYLENQKHAEFILLYGNKTQEQTMFYTELEQLQSKFAGRLHIYHSFTQENKEDALFGRIDASGINYVLKNKHAKADIQGYYLCGPEQMIETASGVLQENGATKTSIYSELFTSSNTKTAVDTSNIAPGSAKLTIIVDDQEVEITMDQKKTILQAAIDHKIDVPYSCQGGVCSSCIAKISDGEVEMIKNQILTDDELEEGLVLTCQSHVKSSSVTVDYDDI